MKIKKIISNFFKAIIFSSALLLAPLSNAKFLDNTIFQQAGLIYQIDPKLIYSVALAESSYLSGKKNENLVAPYPFALRADKAYYPKTKEEAQILLAELLKNNSSVDIGLMQVNSKWHKGKVEKIEHLLNCEINVLVGTRILVDAIKRTPNDLELGIGHYNSWNDEEKAREYGQFVLEIYHRLQNYE